MKKGVCIWSGDVTITRDDLGHAFILLRMESLLALIITSPWNHYCCGTYIGFTVSSVPSKTTLTREVILIRGPEAEERENNCFNF